MLIGAVGFQSAYKTVLCSINVHGRNGIAVAPILLKTLLIVFPFLGSDPKKAEQVKNSVIFFLASKNARVNDKDKYGLTPLHYAAMRGNDEATVELLSCNGIDIEVKG